MLDHNLTRIKFTDSNSSWIQSFDLSSIKCLIVCRGPVRKEAIDVFKQCGVREYGILLSEKDSVVYPKALAPEIRDFAFPDNIHRVPDYMGAGAEEKIERIKLIISIAKKNGYTHFFAGYGFMAEDAEFIEAIEESGMIFMGPSSHVARQAGAKDEAKKLARSLNVSVTPGVDNVTALALVRKTGSSKDGLIKLAQQHSLSFQYSEGIALDENAEALLQLSYDKSIELVTIQDLQKEAEIGTEEIWKKYPGKRIRFKYIGGGGGKGQRVIQKKEEISAAVMEIIAESKVVAPGSNRNFLIELNIENTRHNEIQVIGNGEWCLSLGGRDCSVQMHEQKLLELSLTQELLNAEIDSYKSGSPNKAEVLKKDLVCLQEMETQAEVFGRAVHLNSVSTFESIVEGTDHFFMEMNTRIQVEHRVTEMAYKLKFTNPNDGKDFFYLDSLIEAMALLSVHAKKVPKPERILRNISGAEVRINATNRSLQPHAGGIINAWSDPSEDEIRDDQGIGTRNPDTGAFVHYNLAGAYDSNIALVITSGVSRKNNLEKLTNILRTTELRGQNLETNLLVHYGLSSWFLGKDAMAKPSTQFMTSYLAGIGALESINRDLDLEVVWNQILSKATVSEKPILKRKETLLIRPIEKLFSNPHLLGGFIGLNDGKAWNSNSNGIDFLINPIEILDRLYHYLNLDEREGAPASEMIWDHDEAILVEARSFYKKIDSFALVKSWKDLDSILSSNSVPEKTKLTDQKWKEVISAHLGFQAGMSILKIIPNIGKKSGFSKFQVDEQLELVVPEEFKTAKTRDAFTKALSPPPKSSSDEIIAPMGGMFYAREAPSLPQLIQVGDHFTAGQPLFIIEVMKMFNKISVPFSGTITKSLLENADGKIIAKGQTIFKITPDEVMKEESEDEVLARKKQVSTDLLNFS